MIGLKYFVENNSMSKLELAKKLEVSPALISKWLLNVKNLRKEYADRFAQLFNVDVSLLDEDIDYIIINPDHAKYNILCQSIKQMKLTQFKREKEEAEQKIYQIEQLMT